MKTMRIVVLSAAAAATLACSDGGSEVRPPAPRPPRGGAAALATAGRMKGGTLTADVRLGMPFGSQNAAGGTLKLTEPVLAR